MAELTLRICNICFTESIPLSNVVFFQCGKFLLILCFESDVTVSLLTLGHKACQHCAEGTYRQIHRCAECRRQKGIPHRIYLTSDDLTIVPTMGQVIEHPKKADTQSAATGPNETTENLDSSRGTDSVG